MACSVVKVIEAKGRRIAYVGCLKVIVYFVNNIGLIFLNISYIAAKMKKIVLNIKKTQILQFATRWMDLETIMLSEINQNEKDKYHMMSLTCGV